MIDLEPAHPRLGVAQCPTVVAGADGRDLGGTAVERVEHNAVKEGCTHAQVAGHPLLRLEVQLGQEVTGEPLIGLGVAERGRQPLEAEPVGGDMLRGARRRPVTHQ